VPYIYTDGTLRTLFGNATGAAATALTVLFVLFATAWSCAAGIRACMRRNGGRGVEIAPLLAGIIGQSPSVRTDDDTAAAAAPSQYGSTQA
jgi:hypothetical protein